MTQAEFQNHMQRLVNNYGKAAYSAERANLIWRAVEGLSAEWWGKCVDEFIAYARQAPLMDQIRERIAAERERIWGEQKRKGTTRWEPPRDASCYACKDSGVIFAAQKGTGNPYVFLCGCTAGQADRRAFPRWTAALLDQFDVLEAA